MKLYKAFFLHGFLEGEAFPPRKKVDRRPTLVSTEPVSDLVLSKWNVHVSTIATLFLQVILSTIGACLALGSTRGAEPRVM